MKKLVSGGDSSRTLTGRKSFGCEIRLLRPRVSGGTAATSSSRNS